MSVAINATNFPDTKFREYVARFDLNSDNILSDSELEAVTEIILYHNDHSSDGLTNVIGIEHFVNLKKLVITVWTADMPTVFSSIDISRLINLEELDIRYTAITELDATYNTKLKYLYLNACPNLQYVNVSQCTELLWFSAGGGYHYNTSASDTCNLTQLDLSACKKLTHITLGNTKITSFDLRNNPEVWDFAFSWQYLQELELRYNPAIQVARIYNTPSLQYLDISGNPYLIQAYTQNRPYIETYTNGTRVYTYAFPYGTSGPTRQLQIDVNQRVITNSSGIIEQPEDTQVEIGDNFSFSVLALGSGLLYQWELKETASGEWTPINGATSNTYSNVAGIYMDKYRYRCLVSSATSAIYSREALLEILSEPEILVQPSDIELLDGENGSFSIQANGSSLMYQWQVSINGNAWNDIQYATQATYEIQAAMVANGNRYRCIASNDLGTDISDVAILTVLVNTRIIPPSITQNPQSMTAADGENAIFSVEAMGSDLHYQWQTLQDQSWKNIDGATSPNLTITASALLNGSQYRCQVSNATGAIATNAATLTVNSSGGISTPTIETQPRNAVANVGNNVSFVVVGNGGGLSYQWMVKQNGQWYPITGANNNIYTVLARSGMNGTQYRCLITNSAGSVYTDVVMLTIQNDTPLSFYGYHSIIISGKNTYGEWEMYPTSRPHVAQPEVKTSYVDVPGADGGLDYTELLTGNPHYGYRKGSWEFLLIPQERWPDVYRSLCNYLHGRTHTIVLEDDPNWQYTGRLSVNKWQSAAHNSLIVIDYVLEPNAVNLNDESYSTDEDDLKAAERLLRKLENAGKVIGLVNNQATILPPESYFQDGDDTAY